MLPLSFFRPFQLNSNIIFKKPQENQLQTTPCKFKVILVA